MEIALVGANARELCREYCPNALPFRTLAEASGRSWTLLALSRGAAGENAAFFCTRDLLLPGDSNPAFAQAARARQIIGYGFSPRDTLTLSSVTGSERLLCLQRSLLTANGTLLEPQELPLPPELYALPSEDALLLAGLRLLTQA